MPPFKRGTKVCFVTGWAVLLAAALAHTPATGSTLPVYQVVQSGATASQAGSLAASLGIPVSVLSVSNGLVSFIDPTNYLAVPTTPLTDSTLTSNLLAVTKNPNSAIPITFNTIDFTALSSLTVPNSNTVLSAASNALASAGLTPQNGTPVIGHTEFTAFYTNAGGTLISNRQYLDTSVAYQLSTPNGYPLVGPGAQVQFSYGPAGITRLLYAARQLTAGPSVQLISSNEASNRFARLLPANATINLQLVYWSPPFQPVHGSPTSWNPANIIPWYACLGTIHLTNPVTSVISTVNLKVRLIPATDDPGFIPALALAASTAGNTQIVANVSVTGGAPPYTCLWSGSEPAASTNTGTSLAYTPRVRVAPPPLGISPLSSSGTVTVSWPYPSTGFRLESAASLAPSAWTPFTGPVQTSGNLQSASFSALGPPMFFRLCLTNPTLPRTETLALTITDANGVSIHTNQTFNLQAQPWAAYQGNPGIFDVQATYGCESPNDPGGFTDDREGWQEAMGAPDAGGGTENFCWLSDTAWPGDFIKPVPPGKLPATPWINGDADFSNWGVNTANIVLIVADGNPDSFTSMLPGSTPDQYWTSELYRPGNQEGTVSANNQWYQVNYTNAWGPLGPNDRLDWLCGLLCDVLDPIDMNQVAVWDRWGPAFGGLHIFTGFASEAVGGGAFPKDFAEEILGVKDKWLRVGGTTNTIVQAWCNAAMNQGTGTPAALGPVGPNGVFDYKDYYWYKGTVGPTIPPAQVKGWWYLQGQNPLQFSP